MSQIERIDQACNGQEALDLVIKNEKEFLTRDRLCYDIVVLDLNMPIKDGF
jgi:CheY-like chemotaxis protein